MILLTSSERTRMNKHRRDQKAREPRPEEDPKSEKLALEREQEGSRWMKYTETDTADHVANQTRAKAHS